MVVFLAVLALAVVLLSDGVLWALWARLRATPGEVRTALAIVAAALLVAALAFAVVLAIVLATFSLAPTSEWGGHVGFSAQPGHFTQTDTLSCPTAVEWGSAFVAGAWLGGATYSH